MLRLEVGPALLNPLLLEEGRINLLDGLNEEVDGLVDPQRRKPGTGADSDDSNLSRPVVRAAIPTTPLTRPFREGNTPGRVGALISPPLSEES